MPISSEYLPANETKILTFVTVYDYPLATIETKDGHCTYEQWLKSEAQRVRREFPCAIVRDASGKKIALVLLQS